MAIQRIAAQPQASGPARQRRPVKRMFNGNNESDFYSNEPVQRARTRWSPDIARGPGLGYFSGGFGDFGSPEPFHRLAAQQQGQQKMLGTLPAAGAGTGFGVSHDPHQPGGSEGSFLGTDQGDVNFEAMQKGGNPWISTHQGATRFGENFIAKSIRQRPEPYSPPTHTMSLNNQ